MDGSRELTDEGRADARSMAGFFARQVESLDLIIASDFTRTSQTAEIMAEPWGLPVITTEALRPNVRAEDEWAAIKFLARDAKRVLVVGHGPALCELIMYLISPHYEIGDGVAGIRYGYGSIAHLNTDKGFRAEIHWWATKGMVEREEQERAITEAANELCEALELAEARGEYYYDEVEVKRWILGDGGESGNCEDCEDAADRGDVDMDDVYDGPMGEVDEPPLHPGCDCTIEYRTKRQRVYV